MRSRCGTCWRLRQGGSRRTAPRRSGRTWTAARSAAYGARTSPRSTTGCRWRRTLWPHRRGSAGYGATVAKRTRRHARLDRLGVLAIAPPLKGLLLRWSLRTAGPVGPAVGGSLLGASTVVVLRYLLHRRTPARTREDRRVG